MQKLCPLFGSSFRSTKNTHKISDVVGETKLLILVRLSVLSLPPLSLSLARSLVLPLSSRLYFSFSHVATAATVASVAQPCAALYTVRNKTRRKRPRTGKVLWPAVWPFETRKGANTRASASARRPQSRERIQFLIRESLRVLQTQDFLMFLWD